MSQRIKNGTEPDYSNPGGYCRCGRSCMLTSAEIGNTRTRCRYRHGAVQPIGGTRAEHRGEWVCPGCGTRGADWGKAWSDWGCPTCGLPMTPAMPLGDES